MRHLIAGECVQLPKYNFLTGMSEEGEEIQLRSGEIIIMEGIHGLNPELFPKLPSRTDLPDLHFGADPAQPGPA